MLEKRKVRRELLLGALFLLAAVIVTWPLAGNMKTAVSDLGDPLLNVWIVNWVQYALVHQPFHLFEAPIFYPAKYPLAYSENMIAVATLMMPFRLLGFAPVTVFNFAMLFGFAIACYGASVLARVAGSSMFAAIVTGLGYGFCQFFFDHLPHLQIIWSGFLPLILAGLLNYWRTPTWKNAALAAAAFLGNGLTNIYFLLFVSVAVFVTLVFFFIGGEARPFRVWWRLGVTYVVAGILLFPVLNPYRTVSKLYNMKRGTSEVIAGSATLVDWFSSTGRSALYGRIELPGDHSERRLFPGILPIAMIAVAFFFTTFPLPASGERVKLRGRASPLIHILDALIALVAVLKLVVSLTGDRLQWRVDGHLIVSIANTPTLLALIILLFVIRCTIRIPRFLARGEEIALRDVVARSRFQVNFWISFLWILLGIVGSLGVNGWLHMYLFDHVFAFRSLRAVGRWGVIAYVGMVPWSAAGIDILMRGRRRLAIASAIVIVMIADIATKIRWEQAPADPAPVYRWMNEEKVAGPFLEVPMDDDNAAYFYLLAASTHHRMLMNGTSGFEPPVHMKLRDTTQRLEFNDVLQSLLESNGCRYVVIHGDGYPDRNVLGMWIREKLQSGQLALVRRFDHGVEGDYVFAVTKNADAWKQYARPADGPKLDAYLNHLPVHNESTFAVVEKPEMHSTVFQRLEVEGWALSPNGIQKIEVAIDSGRRRYPARMVARPEINAKWPEYGKAPAGYLAVITKRPKGVPRETDAQVIITDGTGKETRLRDIMITWH